MVYVPSISSRKVVHLLLEIAPFVSPVDQALDTRALAALTATRNFSTEAVRLLLRTKEILLLAQGLVLGHWRDSRDPVSGAFAEQGQAHLKTAELRTVNEILRGRMLRIPAAHRKRYTPEERFRIIVFVRTYSLSYKEAAEEFLIDRHTIARWSDEATREPGQEHDRLAAQKPPRPCARSTA